MKDPVIQSEDFDGITLITITCATPGSTIRYTINGTDPTDASAAYTDTLAVFKTTTVKAIATKSGMNPSTIVTKGVAINLYSHKSDSGKPYVVNNGVATALAVPASTVTAYTCCVGSTHIGDVYVAGTTTDGTGNAKPCYWVNGTYNALPLPLGAVSGQPSTSIYCSGTDVYIMGSTKNSSFVETPCYWKNGAYEALSVFSSSLGGSIGDGMCVASDGSVYVTGCVNLAANADTPCYWKNGTYSTLTLPTGFEGMSSTITVIGTDVYVSGIYYDATGSNIKNSKPCLWVNGTFSKLDAPDLTLASGGFGCGYRTSNVFTSGSDVYVGGYTFQLGSDWIMSPVYWKNGDIITLSLPGYANVSGGAWIFKEMNGKVIPFGSLSSDKGYGQCYWPNGTCVDGFYSYQ